MNLCLGKLSEACGDKEVAREFENDQHVNLEANVFSGYNTNLQAINSQMAEKLQHIHLHGHGFKYHSSLDFFRLLSQQLKLLC